jgi:hypothetical protein
MVMNERLLQHLWQYQYYNKQALLLENNDQFQVIHPGRLNTNQGPDFLEAKIKIENTLWVGNVELHLKTSDWFKHAHHLDRNYDNVVLHVVLDNDLPGFDARIPVFSLQSRISHALLKQYERLMNSRSFIASEQQARQVPELVWLSWLERLWAERLEHKVSKVFTFLAQNNQHWEETFWWLLARSFGTKINADAFEAMAQSLPVTLLAKHKNQLPTLEALLLGQCGLLDKKFTDAYPVMLQKEYAHLKNKYHLQPIRQSVKFLRMRPANFPTVRLAQLAMLIHQSSHLFAQVKETENLADIKKLLTVTANDFWHYHYQLNKAATAYHPKKLGKQAINLLIINAVVPILFAYGQLYSEERYKNKALGWLESIQPESNETIEGFNNLDITYNDDAHYSQAMLHLKEHYCNQKKCLDCPIGNALLKRQLTTVPELQQERVG